MFEELKSWVSNIITVIIFVSLVELILPQGKSKKYIGLVTGLLIIIVIISPIVKVFGNGVNIDIPEIQTTEPVSQDKLKTQGEVIEKIQSKQIISAYRTKLESSVKDQLKDIGGITCQKVACTVDGENEQQLGEIKEITIYLTMGKSNGLRGINPVIINIGKDSTEVREKEGNIPSNIKNEIIGRIVSIYKIKPQCIKIICADKQ